MFTEKLIDSSAIARTMPGESRASSSNIMKCSVKRNGITSENIGAE